MISWPAGYRRKDHQELDSTNEEARRLAEAGEAGPLWITASRQTAGRGRRGRAWDTGAGNLATTLLLRPDAPQAVTGQLSFAAALAAAEMALPELEPVALNTARAALQTTSAQIAVSGRNVSGANDPSYSRKIALPVTTADGSARLLTISRATDVALYHRMIGATSGASSQ